MYDGILCSFAYAHVSSAMSSRIDGGVFDVFIVNAEINKFEMSAI